MRAVPRAHLADVPRCDACGLTGADSHPRDERGIRWAVMDMQHTEGGYFCRHCRTLQGLPTAAAPLDPD